jgi:sorting nexin-9/18/33
MAELETYHIQKIEDFQNITKEHLDGEIQFYEQVLVSSHIFSSIMPYVVIL